MPKNLQSKVTRTPERFREFYEPSARSVARQHGLNDDLFVAQMQAESNFIPSARSPKGAMGIGQIMLPTVKQYAQPGESPFDGLSSMKVAARYLAELKAQFNNNIFQALAAYNWGPGNLKRRGVRHMPDETRDYLRKILTEFQRITEKQGSMGRSQ